MQVMTICNNLSKARIEMSDMFCFRRNVLNGGLR